LVGDRNIGGFFPFLANEQAVFLPKQVETVHDLFLLLLQSFLEYGDSTLARKSVRTSSSNSETIPKYERLRLFAFSVPDTDIFPAKFMVFVRLILITLIFKGNDIFELFQVSSKKENDYNSQNGCTDSIGDAIHTKCL
jgi:hypothetical protein